jgi:ribosomal protein S18 acetylase RimI-like enzyme
MSARGIRVVAYDPRWRADFGALNIQWLEQWFVVEAYDRQVLEDPERHILAAGGRILFAVDDADRALGTVALKHEGDGVWELTKMAVSPDARGRGIGRLLMDAALALYRSLDGRELFLESSRRLAPALALYESAGFRHHPAPRAGSHYARADVHMIWEP